MAAFGKWIALALSGLFVAGSLARALAQPTSAAAPQTTLPVSEENAYPKDWRTWTDSTGKHRTEAVFREYADGMVRLRKRDGTTVQLPFEQLSDADRQYLQSREPGALFVGCGLDPEQARQNAFSNAIEHHVGLLVDSQTRVENDELVSEKILTVSRGYIDEFAVLRTWSEEGLVYVLIRATVASQPLASRLMSQGIPLSVNGEKLWQQYRHVVENERNAAEVFRNIMRRWTMDKLIVANGQYVPLAVGAEGQKLGLGIRLQADPIAWESLRRELIALLDLVAVTSFDAESVRQSRRWNRHYPFVVDLRRLEKQLKAAYEKGPQRPWPENPMVVAVYNETPELADRVPAGHDQTFWRAFVVPKSIALETLRREERPWYDLCIRFTDEAGSVVHEVREPIGRLFQSEVNEEGFQRPFMARTSNASHYFIGPLFWAIEGDLDCENDWYARSLIGPSTATVKPDTLRRMSNCAFLLDTSPLYSASEMDKMIRVETVGKPEPVDEDRTHTKLQVTVRLTSNLDRWEKLHAKASRLLEDTASAHVPISTVPQEDKLKGGFYEWRLTEGSTERLEEKLGDGQLGISVFRSLVEPEGSETVWDVHQVDPRLVAVLEACAAAEYRLRVSLIDGHGNTMVEVRRPVQPEGVLITHLWAGRGQYALAPLLLDRDGGCYAVSATQTIIVEVERDDADRIEGCSAAMEPVLDLPESDAP